MSYCDFDKQLVGRTLKGVDADEGGTNVVFYTIDGKAIHYRVEGDCCSSSWIEHLEVYGDMNGAVVLSVDESFGGDPLDANGCDEHGDSHECLKVYETRVRTNKGDIALEYRNSSNGYYGGYIVFEGEETVQ